MLASARVSLFVTNQSAGHLTLCPTISLAGDSIRPFVIVASKSIYNDLAEFDLPDGDMAYVVHSSSGYMNEELFVEWIRRVWIRGVEGLRRLHNLPGQPAGLLMDGARSHDSAEIRALFESCNTQVIWLLPHSSHLTQPLDLVIFAAYKARKKTIYVPEDVENKQSRRLMRNLRALAQATDRINIRAAWKKAGFGIDKTKNPPQITFSSNRMLENPVAPMSDVKEKKIGRKRQPLFVGKTKSQRMSMTSATSSPKRRGRPKKVYNLEELED